MPTYRVAVEMSVYYRYDVEAPNRQEAENIGTQRAYSETSALDPLVLNSSARLVADDEDARMWRGR